jgi:hypothetical protein
MSTETSLAFHPLTILEEPPDSMVGRVDIESYAAFPEDGVALLKHLQAGMSPQAAEAWYQQQFGESLDIADFIATLRDLQFLQEEGEEVGMVPTPSAFWQWIGRAAFSPPAWLLYSAIMSLCVYLMLRFPSLRPVSSHLFFTSYISLIELGLFFGQIPGIFFHEGFHALAGLRLGIPARLSIGRRFYFLVFETHLNGLWSVPRQRRYLPFLAGMLGDVLWFSLMTILARLTFPSPLSAFALAMAFLTILRLIWQFYFYLQTDIYYVFTTALRCVDLQQTTRQLVLNGFYRLVGWKTRIIDEDQWHPRDQQVARWYALFFLGGYFFSTTTLLFVGVPTTFQFLRLAIVQLLNNTAFTPGFWNIVVFLTLNGLQLGLVLYLIIKGRWQGRKQARERELSERDDDERDDIELDQRGINEAS